MKTAIVTGSSSGIGLQITRMLLQKEWTVYALSRSRPVPTGSTENLIHVPCDLLDTAAMTACVQDILTKAPALDLLVNCAGIGVFGPHEQANPESLSKMLRLNLEVPILLCQLTLRALKASKGKIINISSVTAEKDSVFGCAYSASKAGLSRFSTSLFEEVRKSGVGVTVVAPDLTRTAFYDSLDFVPDEDARAAILPEQIADAVAYIIESPDHLVVSEITMRPQINRIRRKPVKNGRDSDPSGKPLHHGSD
ncbi:MAG: SDR family oxidoreductase [Clostridiales bacterium]|nr:SDR family oxidoreductase [Clostridiales bacterium]